jgi:hypothetical protein
MTRHPRLAERLLTWSLAAADREAVLGDLQEEFAALAAASGLSAARRWYWTQTLTSVLPNLLRRIRGERQLRRLQESDSDRMMRRSMRTASLWMLGAPVALFALAWLWNLDLYPAVGGIAFTSALFGLVLLIGTLSPRPNLDPATAARNRQRNSLFWGLMFGTDFPRILLDPAYHEITRRFHMAGLLLAMTVVLWPKRYWPFAVPEAPPFVPRVRTPFAGTERVSDGTLCLTTEVPQRPAGIGSLILGRAEDPRIVISRVFQRSDAVRLFAAMGEGPAPIRAAVELLDRRRNVVATIPAPILPAVLVNDADQGQDRSRKQAAQIDVILPLASLIPGAYSVRLTATDGASTSEKDTEFIVAG